jgi:hypothetical protein
MLKLRPNKKLAPTRDRVPRSTWMLRGIFDEVELVIAEADPRGLAVEQAELLNSPAVLQPLGRLHLPDCLRDVCFVPQANAIYYTTPDTRDCVHGWYIPNPDPLQTNHERYRSQIDARDAGLIRLGGEVLALGGTKDSLFVLTVTRGRTASDALWLHWIRVSQQTLLPAVSNIITAEVNLNHTPLMVELAPRLVVTGEAASAYRVYLSFGGAQPLVTGRFVPGHKKLSLVPVALETIGASSSAYAIAADRPAPKQPRSSTRGDALLLANTETNSIHAVRFRDVDVDQSKISPLGGEQAIKTPAALARMHLNTGHLDRDLNPNYKDIPLLLIASKANRQIWAINDTSRDARSAPLLGGGSRPLDAGAPENLLDVDIGLVDNICVVHEAAVLFGVRDLPGWGALLMPRMLWCLNISQSSPGSKRIANHAGEHGATANKKNPDTSS